MILFEIIIKYYKTLKFFQSVIIVGYGFINFISDNVALTCMHKLNGKIIPGTQPPVRFKLNHNSNRLLPGEKNHSIWVGDLTPEVDDLSLYRFFSARFQSIVSAKGKCHFACHVLNSVVTNNIRIGGILRL